MKRRSRGRVRDTVSFFQKTTQIYLACMATLWLLYPGRGYEYITRGKAALFFWLTGGFVLVSVLGRLELCLIGGEKWPGPMARWKNWAVPQRAVFLYWCAALVSTLASEHLDVALLGSARYGGFLTITLYCWSFLLISGGFTPRRWLLWLLAGAVSLNCLLAITQLLGYNPLGLYPAGMNYYDANLRYAGEFLGAIGNVDVLSAVLCVAIPLLWISILRLKTPWRFALLAPLALCLVVLFWAFVAGGVVAVLASVLFTPPVLAREKRRRLLLLALALVLLVGGIFAIYAAGDKIGGFPGEASALLHGQWDDSFGSGRLYIWRKTAELIPQRPLLGGGPETLGLRADIFFERFNETTGTVIRAQVDDAHNEYLNILVNQGLLGLLTYLAALGSALITWLRRGPDDNVAAICGGGVFCYSVQALFGIASPASTPLFWICMALCVGKRENENELAHKERVV